MDAALANSERDVAGARGFYRVDPGGSRIEGAPDPRRETTSSQKNGWAANRATHGAGVISPLARVGPLCGERKRGLISGILNYVFTCVVVAG